MAGKAKFNKDEDDDLWGSMVTVAPKTSKTSNMKSSIIDNDDP